MQTQTATTSGITHQQLIELIKTLPPERLRSVYDFVLFMKLHPLVSEDIFGETAEEILADEARWNEQFAASREKLRALAREAAAEYRSGQTKPMEFTSEGRLKQ